MLLRGPLDSSLRQALGVPLRRRPNASAPSCKLIRTFATSSTRRAVAAPQPSPPPPPPPPPPSSHPSKAPGAGLATTVVLALLFAGAGYGVGSFYPPAILRLAFPLPAPERPSKFSPEGLAHIHQIESELQNLPQLKSLLSRSSPLAGRPDQPAAAHYQLVRPYDRYPEERLRHALIGGALTGPGLIATQPAMAVKTRQGALAEGGLRGDAVIFIHLGRSVCGHDGVVHGGMLATIFDEAMARTAFYSLPSHIGVTGRLEVDYRKPTMADQVIQLTTELVESKGRKAIVRAEIRQLDGTLLVEARGIFIEPRFAKFINQKSIREFMDIVD